MKPVGPVSSVLQRINGKQTAFTQRYSNQRPLKALETFTRSRTRLHTDGGDSQPRRATAAWSRGSQGEGVSLGDASTLSS